jgi:thiamine kinase-like enzyme
MREFGQFHDVPRDPSQGKERKPMKAKKVKKLEKKAKKLDKKARKINKNSAKASKKAEKARSKLPEA